MRAPSCSAPAAALIRAAIGVQHGRLGGGGSGASPAAAAAAAFQPWELRLRSKWAQLRPARLAARPPGVQAARGGSRSHDSAGAGGSSSVGGRSSSSSSSGGGSSSGSSSSGGGRSSSGAAMAAAGSGGAQAQAVLLQEPGEVEQLLGDVERLLGEMWHLLQSLPFLGHDADTLQARAVALAEALGQARAAAVLAATPAVLNSPPELWRLNLGILAACGVADPPAVLARHPMLLRACHAAPRFVQRRLLLQRCFGLTAAQLYEGHVWFLRSRSPAFLAQRLQLVEQRGQAHRLMVKRPGGQAPTHLPPHERPLSLQLVLRGTQAAFLAAVGASEADWAAFQRQHPPDRCPLYRWAQQAAAQEIERLLAALPPELRLVQAAHSRRK